MSASIQQRLEIAYKQDVVVLWLGTEILEDTLFPESLHMIPVLNHTMSNRVVKSIRPATQLYAYAGGNLIAYLEFATASSPIKKSRSSIPLLLAKWPGLPATGGGALPPPEPDPPDDAVVLD
jgi:hypothetical protein